MGANQWLDKSHISPPHNPNPQIPLPMILDQFLRLFGRLEFVPEAVDFDFGVEAVGDHVVHRDEAVFGDKRAGTSTCVACIGRRDIASAHLAGLV